jgi:hypothetical protein
MSDDARFDEPYPAWLLDISPGGMRLALRHAVVLEGCILHVKAADAGTATWTRVQVRNCRRTAIQWELGCQKVSFLKPPSANG